MPLEARPTRGFRLRWIFAAVIFIAAVLCISLTSTRKKPESFVWQSPEQVARTMAPGRLTKLKYMVLRWPPAWRWFNRRKKSVMVEVTTFAVSSKTPLEIQQSILCQTNGQNVRVWVVPPEELLPLRLQWRTSPGVQAQPQMRLTTLDGGGARMRTFSGLPASASPPIYGTTADILPKIVSDSCKLVLGITVTEAAASGIRTNVSFGCRALVPNGGALVVNAGSSEQGSGTNYWLIISPTAVDAKGNPIGLKK